jgi:hypothetical protein
MGTGLRVKMMRRYDYARTPPEAPEGVVVFVVRFAEVVMAATYAGAICRRQRLLSLIGRATTVESGGRLTQ